MNIIYKENEKLEIYNYLMETYIDTINKLIDTSYSFGILPFKAILGMNWIKKHISENRVETLQNGIIYLLENKEIILNFDLSNLDDLDKDSDDNMSIKSCVNKLKKNNISIKNNNISNITNSSDDMLNLIIEIKNNTKKISSNDIDVIKKYFELLIIILEKIQKIFL
jgi:hypothetical protein